MPPDTPKEIQGIKDVWQPLEKLQSGGAVHVDSP